MQRRGRRNAFEKSKSQRIWRLTLKEVRAGMSDPFCLTRRPNLLVSEKLDDSVLMKGDISKTSRTFLLSIWVRTFLAREKRSSSKKRSPSFPCRKISMVLFQAFFGRTYVKRLHRWPSPPGHTVLGIIAELSFFPLFKILLGLVIQYHGFSSFKCVWWKP